MRFTDVPHESGWYWISDQNRLGSWKLAFLEPAGHYADCLLVIDDTSSLLADDRGSLLEATARTRTWFRDKPNGDWEATDSEERWRGPSVWFGPLECPGEAAPSQALAEFSERLHDEAMAEAGHMLLLLTDDTHSLGPWEDPQQEHQVLICTADQAARVHAYVRKLGARIVSNEPPTWRSSMRLHLPPSEDRSQTPC